MNEEIMNLKEDFDKLDKMISEYNSISSHDFIKKYDYYQIVYKYILSLKNENKIESDPNKKSLSYLQEIIDNDGPEYAYTITFKPVSDETVVYEIGVCVRGVPLLRKIELSK